MCLSPLTDSHQAVEFTSWVTTRFTLLSGHTSWVTNDEILTKNFRQSTSETLTRRGRKTAAQAQLQSCSYHTQTQKQRLLQSFI